MPFVIIPLLVPHAPESRQLITNSFKTMTDPFLLKCSLIIVSSLLFDFEGGGRSGPAAGISPGWHWSRDQRLRHQPSASVFVCVPIPLTNAKAALVMTSSFL
jgi:hypothetical protein